MRLTVIPPRIWERASKAARFGVNAPTRAIARETAGLKRPPETRKKIQALTAREKPKQSEMYSKLDVSTVATVEPCSPPATSPVIEFEGIKATLLRQSCHPTRCAGRNLLGTTQREDHKQDRAHVFSQHGNEI